MNDNFARALGQLVDLNDVEEQGPATVQDRIPLVGEVSTVITQVFRQNHFDDNDRITGATFTGFLQEVTSEGTKRVVLPDKAMRRLVAQWNALNKRGRRYARQRARDRALQNPTGFAAMPDELEEDAGATS